MRIGFDAKRIFHNQSGLGNYSRDLVEIMANDHDDFDIHLYSPKRTNKQDLNKFNSQKNISIKKPSSFLAKLFPFLWRTFMLTKQARKENIEIFHGLSNELPIGLKRNGIKSVVTIHDLIFLRFPKQYKTIDRMIYRLKSKHACKNADKIIAISEQTKKDIIDFYGIHPEKIQVIYQSCHRIFKKQANDDIKNKVKEKHKLPSKFLLYVGSINERKNLLTILKTLLQLPSHRLVVVGKGKHYKKKCESYIKEHHLESQVLFLNIKETEDLAAIYQMANIMIYPSIFEGFGIPILEALYSKIPVITSEGGCFPEAGGPNSMYIDPNNEQQLKESILKIENNTNLRQEMILKGYSHAQQFSEASISEKITHLYKNL